MWGVGGVGVGGVGVGWGWGGVGGGGGGVLHGGPLWPTAYNADKAAELGAELTSSNGDIFRVAGHLCGEFTGPWWFETPSWSLWRQCNEFLDFVPASSSIICLYEYDLSDFVTEIRKFWVYYRYAWNMN